MEIVRCVAFDFDGTLVRSNDIKRNSFYDVVADNTRAKYILDELFAADFKGDRYDLFQELSKRLAPEQSSREHQRTGAGFCKAYGELCRRRINSCEEVPGAMAALKFLTQHGISTFVVSATPEKDLLPIIRDRGYDHLFKDIFGGPTDKTKHLESIIDNQGIAPAALVMIGDGGDDQAAANAVKCRFIGIANSGNTTLQNAECMINNLRTLPDLIPDGMARAQNFGLPDHKGSTNNV